MNAQRILKQFTASVTSQGVILLQQALLPPLFIARYGVDGYGDWVTLYSAVAFLSTLQFGVQTYVNNELTMKYNRGDMADYQQLQSTALRMLCGAALVASALCGFIFMLPVQRWLGLTSLPKTDVDVAVFFLALQVIANLPLNYFSGTFMVFGMAHRGVNWQNALRLMVVVAAAAMALFHATFASIAIAQFVMVVIYTGILLWDLRRLCPEIFPTLRYWDQKLAVSILAPSGYFALLTSYTFLVYSVPIVIIRRVLGAEAVAVFSLMRTFFSWARQLLQTFTASIGPEVTLQYGRRNWKALALVYSMSERILFTGIPVLNFTMLLASPILLQLWVHKSWMYSLNLYALMAITSAAISVRDHKIAFQASTNTHRDTARKSFAVYALMVCCTPFLVRHFGLPGFLWAWFISESIQAVYVLYLNTKLFGEAGGVEQKPVVRLFVSLAVGGSLSWWLAWRLNSVPLWWRVPFIAAYAIVLALVCAWYFDFRAVVRLWLERRKGLADASAA